VPHVHADPDPDPPGGVKANRVPKPSVNPLWDLWVNEFRMSRLASDKDLDPPHNADAGSDATIPPVQHVPAFLNCEMIDAAGRKLAAMGANGGKRLPYFAAPFRVATTIANLRGIPCRLFGTPPVGTFSGTNYVQHDDFACFAFPNEASPEPQQGYVGKREDEFWRSGDGSRFTSLNTFVTYATASAPCPSGLPPARFRGPRSTTGTAR
jgi:hypothetical protein